MTITNARMTQITQIRNPQNLYHPDLSFQLVGILFKVYNTLGFGYQEKEYQKAISIELEKAKISFERELYCPIKYDGKILRKFFVDFLIDEKIVLEIKVANDIYKNYFGQVLQYLKSNSLKLGIIAAFTPNGVLLRRIVN
jgi:GxxExxY protein